MSSQRMQLVPKKQPTLEAIVYTGENREDVKAFLLEGPGNIFREPGNQIHWQNQQIDNTGVCAIALVIGLFVASLALYGRQAKSGYVRPTRFASHRKAARRKGARHEQMADG